MNKNGQRTIDGSHAEVGSGVLVFDVESCIHHGFVTTNFRGLAQFPQTGRGFVLTDAKEQVHEKNYLGLVPGLVIKEDN